MVFTPVYRNSLLRNGLEADVTLKASIHSSLPTHHLPFRKSRVASVILSIRKGSSICCNSSSLYPRSATNKRNGLVRFPGSGSLPAAPKHVLREQTMPITPTCFATRAIRILLFRFRLHFLCHLFLIGRRGSFDRSYRLLLTRIECSLLLRLLDELRIVFQILLGLGWKSFAIHTISTINGSSGFGFAMRSRTDVRRVHILIDGCQFPSDSVHPSNRYGRRHLQKIETYPTRGINVWMVDGRNEPQTRRFEWISVRHG